MILVTPTWQTQIWYSTLLSMFVRSPLVIPCKKHLILSPMNQVHPLVESRSLTLAVLMVSGNILLQKVFQAGLQNLSQIPNERLPFLLKNRPEENVLGELFHFDLL